MIPFRPSDPFPLISLERHSVSELKIHAATVDRWLGLETERIERGLAKDGSRARAPGASGEKQQLWFGLDVQALMTPYCEIRYILEMLRPRPGERVIDMGAAYGRMAFVLARHFPEVDFIGYEYVGERVREGQRALNRMGIAGKLQHADLAAGDFEPAEAQTYFIYDYGSPKAIEKSLYDLRRRARDSSRAVPITVVGRGRHCRMLIAERHRWLQPAQQGEPERGFTVYRALAGERCAEAG